MRELKFRAFYEQSQTWVYFTFNQPLTDVAKAIHNNICLNGGVFYSFTGLKDKNGKEIYEGDILRVTDKDNEFEPEYIGEVKYDSEICMYLVGNNTFETAFTKIKFEVIGNIHENPDLI